MCKLKQSWRHAASVIVAASKTNSRQVRPHYIRHVNDPTQEIFEQVLGEKKTDITSTSDVSILMAKRRSDSNVMPGAYTFPGGALHPSDFDTHWATDYLDKVIYTRRLQKTNLSPLDYLINVESTPFRPPAMVEFHEFNKNLGDPESRGVWMPPEWAFKLCALRELFEETGILICHNNQKKQIEVRSTANDVASGNLGEREICDKIPLEQCRLEVHKDASNFEHVCEQLDVIPAFWTLHEWSNWLSPSTYATRRRFDTIFYVVCLEYQEEAKVEQKELEKAEWIDPKIMLKSGDKGEIQLAPPQIYELARLARFEKVEKLNKFVAEREKSGLIRFFPLLGKCSDEVRVAILPGDDLYPKEPDFLASDQTLTQFPSTSKELRESSKHLHRAEFTPSPLSSWASAKIYMNVKPDCNHVVPLQSFDN